MHGLSGSIFTMTWLVIETNKTIHECTLDEMLCTILDILVSFAQSIVRTNLSDRQLNKIMHAKTWCLLLLALTISVADRASVGKSTNSTIGSMFVADHYPFLTGHLGFQTFHSVAFIDWYLAHCIVLQNPKILLFDEATRLVQFKNTSFPIWHYILVESLIFHPPPQPQKTFHKVIIVVLNFSSLWMSTDLETSTLCNRTVFCRWISKQQVMI